MVVPNCPFDRLIGVEINDNHTDIVINRFQNRICLFITQYGKLNNLFVAKNETNFLDRNFSTDDGTTNPLEIQHRFGEDKDEIQSAIRYLIKECPGLRSANMEIVFNLGLKDYSRSTLKQLAAVLCEIKV